MKKPTVAIFDVFKTLIDIETDEEIFFAYEFLSTWLSYSGINFNAQNLYESYRYNRSLELYENPNKHPDIDIADVFKRMFSEYKVFSSVHLNKLIKDTALIFRILTTKSLTIYPDTQNVLRDLHQHPRISLCIASNTQRLFTAPELRKFDLEKYFEYVAFSSDVKACKPNPLLFISVLDGMKAKAEEAIVIGDNLFDDIYGAQSIGIRTIWINRGDNFKFPAGFKKPRPDYEIVGEEFWRLPEMIFDIINS